MLQQWWNGHGWPAVPEAALPRLFVIYEDTAAGGLYMSNCGAGVAMLEWLVTNPESAPLKAARALKRVVEFLLVEARRMDYGMVLTTCRQPSLSRLLERSGFRVTDSQMIHLVHTR